LPEVGDRIVEVATVHLDPEGAFESSWDTLINPCRDVGPMSVHGLRTDDVQGAPRFDEIAGHLAFRLAGRVFTAHNAAFDRRFLAAEFDSAGWVVPLASTITLCTMTEARATWSGAPRRLGALCSMRGVEVLPGRSALADALAVAELARQLVNAANTGTRHNRSGALPWAAQVEEATRVPWPSIPIEPCPLASRSSRPVADPSLLVAS
jgi:DNA polymerase-3 subunit epsilon